MPLLNNYVVCIQLTDVKLVHTLTAKLQSSTILAFMLSLAWVVACVDLSVMSYTNHMTPLTTNVCTRDASSSSGWLAEVKSWSALNHDHTLCFFLLMWLWLTAIQLLTFANQPDILCRINCQLHSSLHKWKWILYETHEVLTKFLW